MIFDFFKKDYKKKAESLYYNINSITSGFRFIRAEANPKIEKVVSAVEQFNTLQKETYELIGISNKLDKKGVENLISSIGAIYRHNIMNILKNNLETKKLVTKDIENLLVSYSQVYAEIVKK